MARNNTGSVFFRRKSFEMNGTHKRMYKRIAGAPNSSNMANPRERYRHLGGDVLRKPEASFDFSERADGLVYTWKARHRLQLHQFNSSEIFVCFHCGYPVRSALVAVKEENWDFRMCYSCYCDVVNSGLEDVI